MVESARSIVASLLLAISGAGNTGPVATPRAVWLSGEVVATQSQALLVPPSNSSPVVLRTFVSEGQRVQKGDVVLRIDAAQSAQRLADLGATRAQTAATLDKDLAALDVARLDAELERVRAAAALKKAQIDAGIPREHVSALDFDRYQGELERATREAALRTAAATTASTALARRREDGALEMRKADTEIAYLELQVQASEVRAERAGVVVHSFDPWQGTRYDEGVSAYPGQRAGEIIEPGPMEVRAYALEVDRDALSEGQTVFLSFDALAGAGCEGTITRIGGAPQSKSEWGDGRYYTVEIRLSDRFSEPLLPGASVRVGTVAAPRPAPAPEAARAALELSGEIVALDSSSIAPPAVPNVWMLTLTQLAPDGTSVKKGEPVAAFDASEVSRLLSQKQGLLKEKQSELDRLGLELAERTRTETIATAQQLAAVDKARRKASQPESLLPALQYRKLVAERVQAQDELALLQQREAASAAQRKAEAQLVQSALQRLQQEVAELTTALGALSLTAPRDGVMMHKNNFRGDKLDVGSQVFRGQSVASIPDMSQLAVRAPAPEAVARRIQVGDRVRVDIEGASLPALEGEVSGLGRAVRSKSRVQPVPVVDIEIRLSGALKSLKPGQAVRLKWLTAPKLAGGSA